MKRLLLVLCCVLAGCGARPNRVGGGDELGNGGDPLPKRFERARAKALRVLDAVSSLRDADIPSRAAEVRRFFDEKRLALREDVEATPEYVWVPHNRNGACGETRAAARAPVSLAYEDCRGILTDTDAAIHVIGESVHHVGVREDAFAALVATSVSRAWLRVLGDLPRSIEKRMLFSSARFFAAEVLRRLSPDDAAETADWTWLMGNRLSLVERIEAGRHDWVDELPDAELPEARCLRAVTSAETLQLSYSGCELDPDDRRHAGQLLLAAAIGGEPERASRLAGLALAAWLRTRPEAPTLLYGATGAPVAWSDAELETHALWTGKSLFAWQMAEDRVRTSLYDPRANAWNAGRDARDRSFNSYRDWLWAPAAANDRRSASVWVDGRAVTISHCYRERRTRGAGQMFDPSLDAWTPVSRDGAPNRDELRVTAAGRRVLVWGGKECGGKKPFVGGAFFDPKRGEWEEIPPPPEFPTVRESAVTWHEGRVFLWGGCQDDTCTSEGRIYDERTRRWTRLPSEGAPTGVAAAMALWTETHVVVYGGREGTFDPARDPEIPRRPGGGRYNLSTGKWEPMSVKGAPLWPIDAAWAPPFLIAVGWKGIALYNVLRDTWRPLPRVFVPPQTRVIFWTGVEGLLWNGQEIFSLTF